MSSIQPNVPYIWVPDSHTDRCTACKTLFTLINRKHHCRICGRIFCSECLPYMQSLPSMHETYTTPSHVKCCYKCRTNILDSKNNKNQHIILMYLPLTIRELEVFLYVNKKWNRSAKQIISFFKSVQNKISYQKWTNVERKLLETHFNEIKDHPRLFIGALKALCKTTNINKLMMQRNTHTSCTDLYCSEICTKKVSMYDIMDLLYNKPMVLEYLSVYEWVCNLLKNQHTDVLVLFLPWFLRMGLNVGVQNLIKYILLPRTRDMNFAFKFYFECKMLQQTRDKDFYTSLVQSIVHNNIHYKEILKTEKFINNITNKKYNVFEETRMPYDPNIIVYNIGKTEQLNTYTKPTKITMTTNRGIINVLVKKDDIRIDRLANIMMFLMNEYDDFNLIPYNTFVVNKNEGWVEMIPNVSSLHDINKTTTLQNYILSNNKTSSINELRRTFIKSCASNCILTYLLGVGDRNLNNILVNKVGKIINIDFSYVLGFDPKYEPCEMRITKGMLDMIGGKSSIEYQQFKILCTSMYKEIRKYSFFWYTFMKYLIDAKPDIDAYYGSIKQLKKHVEARFMLNSPNDEVDVFIAETVEKNSDQTIMSMLSDASVNVRTMIDGFMFNLEL